MDVQIIVDKDLAITPAQIAAAWNAGPHGATQARVVPAPATSYDTSVLEIIRIAMADVGVALVASGIQQIVNASFAARQPDQSAAPPAQPAAAQPTEAPPVEVIQLVNPDGSPLLVVHRRT